MCWTDNRVDKVRYFKIMNMWYLPEEKQCTDSSKMLSYATNTLFDSVTTRRKIPITSLCCYPTRWHNQNLPEAASYMPQNTLRDKYHKLKDLFYSTYTKNSLQVRTQNHECVI